MSGTNTAPILIDPTQTVAIGKPALDRPPGSFELDLIDGTNTLHSVSLTVADDERDGPRLAGALNQLAAAFTREYADSISAGGDKFSNAVQTIDIDEGDEEVEPGQKVEVRVLLYDKHDNVQADVHCVQLMVADRDELRRVCRAVDAAFAIQAETAGVA